MNFISDYEKQYMAALNRIYEEGYADGVNERTGKTTKRVPGVVFQVDVEKEFPILKSKFVAAKTALREIEWIWKQQSNNIHDLKAHIWDEWADENGSIGKSYGYQMQQPVEIYTDVIHKTPESFRSYKNQAEFVIEYLREFPNGRWAVATLWNRTELSGMNLVPCCHTSSWNLDGGRLNCVLDQRSGDMPYGVPFNTTQYAELMIMIARDLGVQPGILTHVIADAHIYGNQMEGVELQLQYFKLLNAILNYKPFSFEIANVIKNKFPKAGGTANDIYSRAYGALNCIPKFVITTDETDFFAYNADVCRIDSYNNMGKIDFGEVAV